MEITDKILILILLGAGWYVFRTKILKRILAGMKADNEKKK